MANRYIKEVRLPRLSSLSHRVIAFSAVSDQVSGKSWVTLVLKGRCLQKACLAWALLGAGAGACSSPPRGRKGMSKA